MTRPRSSAPELPDRTGVVVVGGGIAGAAVAYHAAAFGLDVVLVERNRVGGGTTGAAAGILTPPMRQPFHETVSFRGSETARLIWRLAARSVTGLADLIRTRSGETATELDLAGGWVLAEGHTRHEVWEAHEALAEAEFDVEWLAADEVRELTGGRGFSGGYRIRPGGSLNPSATARVLVDAGVEEGLKVVEGVAVLDVERRKDGFVCRTEGGEIRAGSVVYANHLDARRFSPFLADEMVPIRGQAFLTAPVETRFAGCFSTHWKLNVWRQRPDGSLVISGWRHDAWSRSYRETTAEVDDQLQGDLQSWFEQAFPGTGALDVRKRWSGVFAWTADYLPLVGPLDEDEYVLAGFSGGGLPFAFEAGRIVAAELAGREMLPGATLLSPARFSRFSQAP